ncbi:hypothetical protein Tco_0811488 [Tanacetum coccineum]
MVFTGGPPRRRNPPSPFLFLLVPALTNSQATSVASRPSFLSLEERIPNHVDYLGGRGKVSFCLDPFQPLPLGSPVLNRFATGLGAGNCSWVSIAKISLGYLIRESRESTGTACLLGLFGDMRALYIPFSSLATSVVSVISFGGRKGQPLMDVSWSCRKGQAMMNVPRLSCERRWEVPSSHRGRTYHPPPPDGSVILLISLAGR